MSTKNNNVSETDTKATAEAEKVGGQAAEPSKEKKPAPAPDKNTNFVYIGPSLPNGRLKSNTILRGTLDEITEYYKDALKLFPGIKHLFIPASRLAKARENARKSGNIMNKYYQDVAAEIKAKGEQE